MKTEKHMQVEGVLVDVLGSFGSRDDRQEIFERAVATLRERWRLDQNLIAERRKEDAVARLATALETASPNDIKELVATSKRPIGEERLAHVVKKLKEEAGKYLDLVDGCMTWANRKRYEN